MAVLDNPTPVNLVRSIFLCNVFNFFMSASKACLLPFLTLYLKKLGLSATQTGLIIGAKTFVGLIFAPLWSKCAVRCGRRRLMLMFSLLAMAATYLSLTAVPSMDETAFASRCEIVHPNFNQTILNPPKAPITLKPVQQISTVKEPAPTNNKQQNVTETNAKPENTNPVDTTTLATLLNATMDNGNKTVKSENNVSSDHTEISTLPATSRPTTTTLAPTSTANHDVSKMLKEILLEVGLKHSQLNGLSVSDLSKLIQDLLKSKSGRDMVYAALEKLPDDVSETLKNLPLNRKRRATTNTSKNETESAFKVFKNSIWKQLQDFRDHVKDTKNQMFIVLMVILMVGEALSSPIEKIADDGWFEFLEGIDDIEKYGMQRIWSNFAYILLPVIITLIIDNTNCLFGMSVHPFMLHFYMFAGFLSITFLLAFCYPMRVSEKYKYVSKIGKGINVVCCNFRSLLFVLTLLIMGMVYSSYYNFLFWLLADLGSGELTMGMCLTLAALAEIPMLLFNDRLVEKIGNGGVVSISLLFLSARCLYYSFLSTPWAVLPAELSHAFTHTAMWWAILSSPAFNTSPSLSRSIRSILSTVYFGLGFAFGSAISGIIYETFGPVVLFQGGAVVSIAWFPALCMGVRCCREKDKSHVKYTRLLTSDDASDDSDELADDWLEKALKDR